MVGFVLTYSVLSVFILFVLYYSPFCCFATTTTASMHLSPAGQVVPTQPTISVAFCSKGRMIVYDKIHTYSTRPHDSIPFCYLQGGGDCLLVECEFHFSFNFCFCTRHCTTSFFTWLEVYWKTQALILMRCATRL